MLVLTLLLRYVASHAIGRQSGQFGQRLRRWRIVQD